MGAVHYTFNGPRVMLSMVAKARQGLKECAFQTERMCEDLCPVKTGFMRSTIVVTAGTKTERNRDLFFSLIVGAEYSTFVEFGTSRNKPKPFVRPSLEWAKANMVSIIQANAFKVPWNMNVPKTFGDVM